MTKKLEELFNLEDSKKGTSKKTDEKKIDHEEVTNLDKSYQAVAAITKD
jgi:hypothetical protein